jgi:hypothetical protein
MPGFAPGAQRRRDVGIERGGEVAVAVAGFPHHALQRLQCGVLAVLVDPALQGLDDHRVLAHAAVLDRDRVQPAADFGFIAVFAHEARQRRARVREQHVLHEGNAARSPLDVRQDRSHQKAFQPRMNADVHG